MFSSYASSGIILDLLYIWKNWVVTFPLKKNRIVQMKNDWPPIRSHMCIASTDSMTTAGGVATSMDSGGTRTTATSSSSSRYRYECHRVSIAVSVSVSFHVSGTGGTINFALFFVDCAATDNFLSCRRRRKRRRRPCPFFDVDDGEDIFIRFFFFFDIVNRRRRCFSSSVPNVVVMSMTTTTTTTTISLQIN